MVVAVATEGVHPPDFFVEVAADHAVAALFVIDGRLEEERRVEGRGDEYAALRPPSRTGAKLGRSMSTSEVHSEGRLADSALAPSNHDGRR